eukprot:366391-Chlamydomonas_euryale.AAC.9
MSLQCLLHQFRPSKQCLPAPMVQQAQAGGATPLVWMHVEREIRLHSMLDHPNVIRLYVAFEDAKNVYMVQEFAGNGDLFEHVRKCGGRLEDVVVAADFVLPFLNSINHLHSLKIIHRDIKPENILLSAKNTLKLADFGLSIDYGLERPVTRAGTLDYMVGARGRLAYVSKGSAEQGCAED